MSWLVRSLASQFQDKDKDKEEEDDNGKPKGVKEDLNQLQDALRKQLWGVANFIAPPPSTSNDNEELSKEIEKEKDGIGEKFKTGFSRISRALPDSKNLQAGIADRLAGVAKFAQEILNVDEHDAVGVTEEVLGFASTVSQHPGTWLNFPLHIIDTAQEFEMSDVQQEHALTIERLIPTLSALRFELCPAYMSEGQFWKIYFVLLHPILNKEDAALLSTPQLRVRAEMVAMDARHLANSARNLLELLEYKSNGPCKYNRMPPEQVFRAPSHRDRWDEQPSKKRPRSQSVHPKDGWSIPPSPRKSTRNIWGKVPLIRSLPKKLQATSLLSTHMSQWSPLHLL